MQYVPKEINWGQGKGLEIMKENQALLDKIDQEAKDKSQLLWRYIQESYADGYAVYQIIKVNKNSVRIRCCSGLGDDWMIPYWGEVTTIDMEYAMGKVQQRDNMADLFGAK